MPEAVMNTCNRLVWTRRILIANLLAALSANMITARTCKIRISSNERLRLDSASYICCNDRIVVRTPTSTKAHKLGRYSDCEEERGENQRHNSARISHWI